ncbi:AAA family ATPase [Vibrio vulnificus]|nr:AAA family ATPase [Vibrio vulnificus]
MIVNYSFENFQSYKDLCDVNFSVTSKTPISYYDYETFNGKKVAKVMAVIGPNGSGKSNLLKPLSFVSWFASNSFGDMRKGEKIPVIPHRLKDKKSTKISIDFIIPKWETCDESDSELEFRYVLEIYDNYILEETLKLKTSRQYSRIFERKYIKSDDSYRVNLSKSLGPDIQESILEKAPKNCSLISYIDNLRESEESPVCDDSNIAAIGIVHRYFYHVYSNLTFNGRSHLIDAMDQAVAFYSDFPEQFNFTKKLLRKYDLGIDDIIMSESNVVNRDGTKSVQTLPFCIHNTEDGSFEIPLFMESSGTQSAFCTMAMVCESLASGGLLILDEFDNDFHPELSMAIINLFKDSTTNPKNSQLLFNTHTVEVLKHIKRQHVYFVEKHNGNSEAYRGDQIEGLKDRDNLYKKYISGALGAYPEID